MVYSLPVGERERVRELFAAKAHHLALDCIIRGATAGEVYVDDPIHPTSALACSRRRHYLGGAPDNEAFNAGLRQLYAEVIYPRGLASDAVLFMLQFTTGWEASIPAILEGKYPIRDERCYYLFRALKHDWRALLPAGFELRSVDRALLAEGSLGNLEALQEEMCSERPSVDDWLAHSFGTCLLHGNEIVCWSLSEYDGPDRCEIGIETQEPYQRRGLATITASAAVEGALARGILHVGWDAWASNAASLATARKVGFELRESYPVYFAWFDEAANLAVNGNMRLRAGDPGGAVPWFERAIASGRARPWAYLAAARAYAGAGQPDAALVALRMAVERGYRDVEELKRAEELRSLHSLPGWQTLVRELGGD